MTLRSEINLELLNNIMPVQIIRNKNYATK
jgi:hypothetical protein